MGLFKRGKRDDDADGVGADPIGSFWHWWQTEGASTVAAAIDGGKPLTIAPLLSERVHAIDEGLAWELGAGEQSRHVLVVSCEGQAALRATARRWLLAAPRADAVWSFADARPAVVDLDTASIEVEGEVVPFDEVRIAAQRQPVAIDVVVHHPSFVTLDESARRAVAFLALDAALGETDVECWIGTVSFPQFPPNDAFPLSFLTGLVADLKAEYTDPGGEPTYLLFEGQSNDGPILAMAQVPLAPATAPGLDTHVAIFLPYLSTDDSGMPSPGSLQELRHFEESLTSTLGDSGRVVGHQTSASTRVMHVYVDSASEAPDQASAAARRWTLGSASAIVTPDPEWEMVEHLRP